MKHFVFSIFLRKSSSLRDNSTEQNISELAYSIFSNDYPNRFEGCRSI
jgi:hypothetical protein